MWIPIVLLTLAIAVASLIGCIAGWGYLLGSGKTVIDRLKGVLMLLAGSFGFWVFAKLVADIMGALT